MPLHFILLINDQLEFGDDTWLADAIYDIRSLRWKQRMKKGELSFCQIFYVNYLFCFNYEDQLL